MRPDQKSRPYEIRRKWRIATEMCLKRLPGDGGYSRDSFYLFGKLYEKGVGKSSSFTHTINTLHGKAASIS